MATSAEINGKTTIREVLSKYPHTRIIFERYGLLECGGPRGPREPISFFARVHRVNEEQLLEELREAVLQKVTQEDSLEEAVKK